MTLSNICMVTMDTNGNNDAVSTIFAYDGAETVSGGIAFFPKDVNAFSAMDHGFYMAPAYINGEANETYLKISATTAHDGVEAGFYTYTINDATKLATFERISDNMAGVVNGKNDVKEAGGMYWIVDGTAEYSVPSDTPVIDLRATEDKISTIEELDDLLDDLYNAAWDEMVDVCYVLDGDEVMYIYVVSNGDALFKYTVTVVNEIENSNLEAVYAGATEFEVGSEADVKVTLSTVDGNNFQKSSYTLKFTVNDVPDEVTVTTNNVNTVEVPLGEYTAASAIVLVDFIGK